MTESRQPQQEHYHLECPGMPLAVYREVAAHLQMVPGVDVELLPQSSTTFDYQQSQIGGLSIRQAPDLDRASQDRLAEILNYYSDRFGAWLR